MLTRRGVLGLVMATVTLPSELFAQTSTFAGLLNETLARSPDLLTTGRGEREAEFVTQLTSESRGPRPRYPKPSRSVSSDAERLIIACEVTSPARYARLYERPVWPKGRSGVTVGVGYDIGYVDPVGLQQEWTGLIPAESIAALSTACGVVGERAQGLAARLRPRVRIPWDVAQRQFQQTTLPLYVAQTLDRNFLPRADLLPNADCLGALVSLVFNRGPSFNLQGDRYREMRDLRLHVVRGDYAQIPASLRSMKRLWKNKPDAQGLVIRRELEARLFEQGLATA